VRVACLEWIAPPFSAGHWVPEMVSLAGGLDTLASPGDRSRRLETDALPAADPEVLVLMPCGFEVENTIGEYRRAELPNGWDKLRAVRSGQVYATDANAYFSRPGPRLVRGIEILREILAARQGGRAAGEGWSRVDML
jgi:iron complex transport system substrate-binding protein